MDDSRGRQGSSGRRLLPRGPSFLDSTWYTLARAGSLAHQRWAGMIADFDINPGQYKVLMTLGETGSICQQALASLIGVDPRNVVPIVDSLAERGLIERAVDRADRRRRLLTLSAAGLRPTAGLASVGTQIERDLLARWRARIRTGCGPCCAPYSPLPAVIELAARPGGHAGRGVGAAGLALDPDGCDPDASGRSRGDRIASQRG